jgi:hypothetical protein
MNAMKSHLETRTTFDFRLKPTFDDVNLLISKAFESVTRPIDYKKQ